MFFLVENKKEPSGMRTLFLGEYSVKLNVTRQGNLYRMMPITTSMTLRNTLQLFNATHNALSDNLIISDWKTNSQKIRFF